MQLKVAVALLRLYPPDSPQVLRATTGAYQALLAVLSATGTGVLSAVENGLMWNGQRVSSTSSAAESAWLTLVREAGIKSITFRSGLTLEELVTFLHALTVKFWDVKEGREINRQLAERRVLRIAVDEVVYVAVGEGDLVIPEAARKIEGGDTRLSELMRSLDQAIDATAAQGIASEARLEVMKRLLEKDPTLLERVRRDRIASPREADALG